MDTAKITNKALKLTYLINSLKGYAFDLVSHLSIEEANFDPAITLLKAEFLDENFLIHQHLREIREYKVSVDSDFLSAKKFLNTVRSHLQDLKNFGCDFTEESSSGLLLLSDVVFLKLPSDLRREIIRKGGKAFPTLNEIFSCYHDVY